ncbi:MAG: hypothetical protein WC236_03915 [Gallionellaceae bacterium]|jgi:hypothetical protein
MKVKIIVIVMASFIAGCGSAPKSPQELRQSATNGSMGMEKSSFVVQRSLSDLAKTYDVKSKECLNVTVERELTVRNIYGGAGKGESTFLAYSSKVKSTIKQLELNVQMKVTGKNTVKLVEEPEGGYYLLSAEVSPINNSQSNVTLYYYHRYKNLLAAVQGWSTGKDLKCPDLTKDI